MSISLTDKRGDASTHAISRSAATAWACGSACARAAATAGRTPSTTPTACTPDDVVFEQSGVKVIVSADSLELIDGTEVDFIKDGLNEAFKFRNPNVKGECGCGESFSV